MVVHAILFLETIGENRWNPVGAGVLQKYSRVWHNETVKKVIMTAEMGAVHLHHQTR